MSSTQNAHFQYQHSSRLRETIVFFESACMVYVKHTLLKLATAISNMVEVRQNRFVNLMVFTNGCFVYTKCMFFNLPFIIASLVYTKCTLTKSTFVSPTWNAMFFQNCSSRLRKTLTFEGRTGNTQPGRAHWGKEKKHMTNKTCISSTRNAHVFHEFGFWAAAANRPYAFRLHETTCFFENDRVVYAKHPLATCAKFTKCP